MSRTSPRQPGRPSSQNEPDARAALLDAASRLFATHPAGEVPLRRVAEEAGVSSAMVHYYFDTKDGLYQALLERMLGRILSRVRAVVDRRGSDPADPRDRLDEILEVATSAFAAEPFLIGLVVREVLSEGGRYREQFVRDYASQMASLIPQWMRREAEAGRFREDLDPQLAFLSFMGMTLMPFLARPVVEQVLGIAYDEAFLRRFAAHTRKLFLEGAQA